MQPAPTTPGTRSSRRPLRVIHVYKDVWPPVEGGIERIIHHLARLTHGAEFEVGIITAARGREAGGRRELLPGVWVEEVASLGRAMSTPLAPGFLTALRRAQPDLLHFHVPHPTGELAWLMAGPRVPAVATYHSDVVRQRAAMLVYNAFFQRFLGRLDCIMLTSQRYLETSASLAPHRERCRVVPLGYPLEDYAATAEVERREAELRAAHGEFVLFLGCLRAYKGLPYLLEAMRRLPQARLLIAGDGREGPALRTRVAELGLGGRVVFLGRVSEAEAVALLHAAALFVLPAHQRSEAFGLCQIEAMACGLPVVSTDLPTGVPEVNAHGESGLIVPPADPAALAEAIGALLADPARRRELGEGGRQRALRLYRAERMAEEVMQVYRDVIKK